MGVGYCRRRLASMITGLPPGLDWEICDRARLARDSAFDGLFFSGVRTTRIYCRPVCPVRPARSANVVFFASAAAAERAGFRPCLRCRPETAPGSPAWSGTATTVARAMRLIEAGFLNEASVAELADRLGMGSRHLLRYLFGIQEQRLPRSRLLGVSRKPSGSSTRPRCQCQRSPSPLGSAACGASTMPFGRRMAVRLHHSARSEATVAIRHLRLISTPEVSVAEHVGSRDWPTDCISSRVRIRH